MNQLGVVAFLASFVSGSAFAADGVPKFVDYYHSVVDALGVGPEWISVVGMCVVLALITLGGLAYKRRIDASAEFSPEGRVSVRSVVEMIMGFVHSLARENCGEKFERFFPFLSALFIIILISNLTGMIPGFHPPTGDIATNLAMGIVVFVVYNVAGIKEHGWGYLKHFAGPVWWIAPLFFCIELVSHSARPLSLGLRLLGNIFGDHLMLGVFTGLTFVGFPAVLMFFGLLVACVQSFIFTLLTSIYISMAVSHDH